MITFGRLIAVGAAALGLQLGIAGAARAVPVLQIDILGGHYDTVTDTVVSAGEAFTLLALATPGGDASEADILATTYFLSVAIVPKQQQNPALDVGSFVIDGVSYDINDLDFGTPPVDASVQPDLGGHGIFDTYFLELDFMFDGNDATTTYNVENDTGGGLFDASGSGSFFYAFDVDVSGLSGGLNLHFDLYNLVEGRQALELGDVAPFSHDAESSRTKVPEPATLALFGLGLAGLGLRRRRR